jgi:MFS family permease
VASNRFYGWTVVAAAFLIFTSAYSLHFGFGVFVPYLVADLGLDRASATAPFSIYIAIYSVISIAAGKATDRFGPRMVVIVGGVLLGSAFMLMSRAETVIDLYLSLCLMAGIGMGAAYIPLNATVVKWFVRRRGLALAIAGSGTSSAMFVGPLLAATLIPWLGWRSSLFVLGLGCGMLVIFCAFVLVGNPELRNLHPDGDDITRTSNVAGPRLDEPAWTLSEARRTSAFWLILAAFFMSWATIFFPAAHLPSMVADHGYSAVIAASLVGMTGFGGLLGRWIIGWLSDLYDRRISLVACFATQAVGYFMFALFDGLAALYTAALLVGIGVGSSTTIFPALIGDTFGRLHVGAIAGFVFGISGTAAAIGPYFGGLTRELTGTYISAFVACAILNIAALGFIAIMQPPKPAGRK